jgi:putative flavoprotein involved in K+ transport
MEWTSLPNSMKNQIFDAVVIGAGWAGLGVSYALKQAGLRHRLIERGRIGETWRTQRWDSFKMNTPNVQTIMPGDEYVGLESDGVMTRDEFVVMLEGFAGRNYLPIELNTPVIKLVGENGTYFLSTDRGQVQARNVVITTGNLNCPRRPTWSDALPHDIHQIDSSSYRNAADLPEGVVLIVGSGQSGGQIAEDLLKTGRTVFLSTSQVGRYPRRYRGRDSMLWMAESGLLDRRREQFIRASGRIARRPLVGAEHTISLQALSATGATLLGRCVGIEAGQLRFANDLADNMQFADEVSARFKRQIDEHILRSGIDAISAVPDPAEIVEASLPNPPISTLDVFQSKIGTVIWCTGFKGDFRWVKIPGLLDAEGQPLPVDNISNVPGIYFAGLDLASTRRSGTILAIAEEAARIVEDIGSG